MPTKVFTYVWEYCVKPEHQDAFEHAYGPHGDWIQLFKKGMGHVATELHQDINNTNRFVTVDYWISKEAFDNFKIQFHEEFKALDKRFEVYTISEKHIGDFEAYIEKYQKE
ncbi:MAG: antibiotic biosynthesis monooxygenase [Cyclobacteriaceae bacterium]